jgi:hypothetical protein
MLRVHADEADDSGDNATSMATLKRKRITMVSPFVESEFTVSLPVVNSNAKVNDLQSEI